MLYYLFEYLEQFDFPGARMIAISERKDTYPNILAPGKSNCSKYSNK